MEGNNWIELAPGMFQTGRPTFRFSDLDLYNMGLIPAMAVRPSFLIAEPANLPRNVSRDSGPEFYNRTVTITGRRVDVTIDDIVRANGARMPAYPDAPRDMSVLWVLLVSTPDDVDDQLAAEFDEAIDSCSLGYSSASNNLGHLIATVPEVPDAGEVIEDVQESPDIVIPEDVVLADAGAPSDRPEVSVDAPATTTPPAGGCHCRAAPTPTGRGAGAFFACAMGLAAVRRRRARAGASVVRSRG